MHALARKVAFKIMISLWLFLAHRRMDGAWARWPKKPSMPFCWTPLAAEKETYDGSPEAQMLWECRDMQTDVLLSGIGPWANSVAQVWERSKRRNTKLQRELLQSAWQLLRDSACKARSDVASTIGLPIVVSLCSCPIWIISDWDRFGLVNTIWCNIIMFKRWNCLVSRQVLPLSLKCFG